MPKFRGTWSIAPQARGDGLKSEQYGPVEAENETHFQRIVREHIAKSMRVAEERVSVTGVVRAP